MQVTASMLTIDCHPYPPLKNLWRHPCWIDMLVREPAECWKGQGSGIVFSVYGRKCFWKGFGQDFRQVTQIVQFKSDRSNRITAHFLVPDVCMEEYWLLLHMMSKRGFIAGLGRVENHRHFTIIYQYPLDSSRLKLGGNDQKSTYRIPQWGDSTWNKDMDIKT